MITKMRGALTRTIVVAAAVIAVAFTLLVSVAPVAMADPPQQPPVVSIDFGGPSVATDITRNDGSVNPAVFLADPRPGIGEIGQVSPNCITGPEWDLMGFGFQPNVTSTTSSIWMASGFDPRSSVNTEGYSFGGLFIDTDGHYNSGIRPVNADGFYNYKNRDVGFEYAINVVGVSGDLMTYQLVGLSPDSILQSSYFEQNKSGGDPWRLISSSVDSVIFTKTTKIETVGADETLAKTGINTGGVYADQNIWSFEVSNDIFWKLNPQTPVTVTGTISCGNDYEKGAFMANVPVSISAVPEPGSALGVAGLLASALLIRSRGRHGGIW